MTAIQVAGPIFIGCTGWTDVSALMVRPPQQPKGLAFAFLEPTDWRPGTSINVLWRDSDGWHWIFTNVFPGEQLIDVANWETANDEALLFRLIDWVLTDRMAGEGLDHVTRTSPPLIAAMQSVIDRLVVVMAAQGVRPAWTVTASSGDYDMHHTTAVAVYDDLETAILHASRAQARSTVEDAQAEAEDRRPEHCSWDVDVIAKRDVLPIDLADKPQV